VRNDHAGELRTMLAMACRELDADAALLSEIRDGYEHVRWGAGEDGYVGGSYPLADTVCERLLSGAIGPVVPDTALEPALAGLDGIGGIRAYIGVPFKTADARAYVICCLVHEARPDLGARDLRFLVGLTESLRPLLESAR
jgi:hypothetical protein